MNHKEQLTAVLLFSGGVDSTVLFYDLLKQGVRLHCLLMHYGQKHVKELNYAQQHCRDAGVSHDVIALPREPFQGSTLTGGNGAMSGGSTVVPNRNAVMISMATACAKSRGFSHVAVGCNADDSEIYPDCRPEFIAAMSHAIDLACGVRIHAPFLGVCKSEIIAIGRRLRVDFSKTWSCYAGDVRPCGECGACNVARAAFEKDARSEMQQRNQAIGL